MKYQVGDRVRIKENAHKIITATYFNHEMEKFEGKTFEISRVLNNHYIFDEIMNEDGYEWYWCEEWVEDDGSEIIISENDFKNMFN